MILARSGDTIQLVGLGFFIGAGLIYSGVKRLLRARRIQDTARNSIAHAPQGNTELEAFAWCLNQPIKNANGELCAYYRIRLEQYVRRNKNSYWEKRWENHPHPGFIAVDKTGAVLVFCEDAEMHCHKETTSWSDVISTKKRHDIISQVETGYGKISTGFFGGSYRIVEEFLTMGSPCYIQGSLSGNKAEDTQKIQPELYSFFSYLHKRPPGDIHQNKQFDKNGDGTTCDEEAAQSLHTVAVNILNMEISAERIQKETPPLHFYGQINKSPDHLLIVAAMHEHHLLKNINTFNYLRIIGGAFLVTAAIVFLITTQGVS